MLPAANRLKRDDDFRKVATEGRYAYSPLLTVKFRPNRLKESRFGFVISTKVDKSAVARNRVRRQMREIIRLNLANLRLGFDVMIIMKKASIGKKYIDLAKDVLSVLEKARLYAK